MATFLAIFSILTGTASLLGLYHVFRGEEKLKFKKITIASFVAAAAVSLYILVVPGNYFENTVKSKIQYYSKESTGSILVQKGEFSYGGMKPYAVMFPEPFKNLPHVEIVNVNGYGYEPSVEKVTPFQVIFDRNSSGPSFVPQSFQSFVWVATGEPLGKYEK